MGVENENNKKSVFCQQPQRGERGQLMQPGCEDNAGMLGWSRDVAMLILGYFAVPPAGPAPARVEISTPVLAAGQVEAALVTLLPRLCSTIPLGCREGSAPALTPTLIAGHYRDLSISVAKYCRLLVLSAASLRYEAPTSFPACRKSFLADGKPLILCICSREPLSMGLLS